MSLVDKMNKISKIIIIGLLFIAGLMIAINLESTVNWSRNIAKKTVEKYKDKHHKKASFEINPGDITATYWLEKSNKQWSIVIYLKNENLFCTRTLKLLENRSLGYIDSTQHSPKRFGKKGDNYSYFLKTVKETLDIKLKPRQEKEYRFEYSDSVWINVGDEKGNIIFGAPLLPCFSLMDRYKLDAAMHRKYRSFNMKYWYPYDRWSETMDNIRDLPDGVYWPGDGVLAKLNYPDKPLVTLNDSFSITYYIQVPTMVFKEYGKDTLNLSGAIVHKASKVDWEIKNDESGKKITTIDLFKSDSKNVTYEYDDSMKVREDTTTTYFSTILSPNSVRKITVKGKVKKEDMDKKQYGHSEYKMIGKEYTKYSYYHSMWYPFPSMSVRYWFPYMSVIGSYNIYAQVPPYQAKTKRLPEDFIVNGCTYSIGINPIPVVVKVRVGPFGIIF